jgi:acyl carrier protein
MCYFGALQLGATVAPLNITSPGPELAHFLNDSQAVTLVTVEALLPAALYGVQMAGCCRQVLVAGTPECSGTCVPGAPAGAVAQRCVGRPHLEQALAILFTEELGVTSVQPTDNFFDLGGDSLSAMRLLLAVEEGTGRRMPPEYFHNPTLAQLARLISDDVTAEDASLPPAPRTPASPIVKRAGRFTPGKVSHRLKQTGPHRRIDRALRDAVHGPLAADLCLHALAPSDVQFGSTGYMTDWN